MYHRKDHRFILWIFMLLPNMDCPKCSLGLCATSAQAKGGVIYSGIFRGKHNDPQAKPVVFIET